MVQSSTRLVAGALTCLSIASMVACGEQSTGLAEGEPVKPSHDASPANGTDNKPGAATGNASPAVATGSGVPGSTAVASPGDTSSGSRAGNASTGDGGSAGSAAAGRGTSGGSSGISASRGGSTGNGGTTGQGAGGNDDGPGGAVSTGASGGEDAGGSGSTGVRVQMDETFQTIVGFGIGSFFVPGNITLPMDVLFGTSDPNALGLSILRVVMAPDGSLSGSGISEAKALGAKIIGTVMSPPADCKTNGMTRSGGHIISNDGGACYESWSTTIADFAKAQGLYAMSIANEPDFASCGDEDPPCSFDFDTTVFTAREMVEWVKVAGPKLKAAGVEVIAPETQEWVHLWSNASATGSTVSSHPNSTDPLECGCFSNTPNEEGCAPTCLDGNGYDYGHWLWNDQDAWASFDILGVQQYDSQIANAWPNDVNGGVPDKEVWQTEMSGVRYWPEEGPSVDSANGIAVAGWIHSALTVGQASAWVWRFYEAFFQNDNEGLALVQASSQIVKRYYTFGNYSRFVRPGHVAVAVVGNEKDDVLLSAYRSEGGQAVIVAINRAAATEFPITVVGGTAPSAMTPHVTSATENLAAGAPIPVTDGVFTASLAEWSVTTFVGE